MADADFRWQAYFQNSTEPLFLLNRQRRLLFVNRAWEQLTKRLRADVRGMSCRRKRPPAVTDPFDYVLQHALCPPDEAMRGKPARTRRLVPLPEGSRWWDVEFFPLSDAEGLRGLLGKIIPVAVDPGQPALPPVERLGALASGLRQRYGFDSLTSNVPAVYHRLVNQVRLASQSRMAVLIRGETGSGKESVARVIHHQGITRDRPFAALDCARLPAGVLDVLLFGEGRLTQRAGTIYLKEPARLPRELQASLNEWMGEADADAPRVIAGYTTDPGEDVRAGRLLDEFHCRLATLVLEVPPLRDRLVDLPWLAERMLQTPHEGEEQPATGLTQEAWDVLLTHRWPGNLRELYDVLIAARERAAGRRIDRGDLPMYLRMTGPAKPAQPRSLPLDLILQEAERRLIMLALKMTGDNKDAAAPLLAIWKPRLWRRLYAFGLEEPKPGRKKDAEE